MSLPKIALIFLGGTITMMPQDDGGIAPSLNAEQLLAAVPGLADLAELCVVQKAALPSASLTLNGIAALAVEIDVLYRQGIDGIVVVQGTDTIEETAFLLDLLVQSENPLVVTGAMRGPAMPGADGSANLLASVLVASSSIAVELGALVVMNDEIHAARFVQKSHSFQPSAFCSPDVGPLGYIVEKQVRLYVKPRSFKLAPVNPSFQCASIALVKVALDDNGWLLEKLRGLEYAGVVIEGVGAGHVGANVVQHLAELARMRPVILASRVHSGGMLSHTYGYPGSEIDLLGRGLIAGGFLSGLKARLLLAVLCGNGHQHQEIDGLFKQYLSSSLY